jgi:hypothetical protein
MGQFKRKISPFQKRILNCLKYNKGFEKQTNWPEITKLYIKLVACYSLKKTGKKPILYL